MKRDLISPDLLPHIVAARGRFARTLIDCRRQLGRGAAVQFLKIVKDAQARVAYAAEQDVLENIK